MAWVIAGRVINVPENFPTNASAITSTVSSAQLKKSRLRFGLKAKLLLLSSFLFVIPWFGYQYVWEMEKYLRFGQEQTIVGTARALATALHERTNLFNNQASFLPSVEKGKDLYGYQFNEPIQLDGLKKDWFNYTQRAHYYDATHSLNVTEQNIGHSSDINSSISLSFSASVAKYDKYLYLFYSIKDDHVIFRGNNARSVVNNDHIELAFNDNNNNFKRFIISNKSDGWINAFHLEHVANTTDEQSTVIITPAPKIQGQWLTTAQGYNIELRIPLNDIGDKIAFAVHDVDKKNGDIIASIGSASPKQAATLGTILVPSPEIERIVKGMRYAHSSIWVIDQHHRVLASAGSLLNAGGVWQKNIDSNEINTDVDSSFYQEIYHDYLLPLYYKILTKPPSNFIDKLYDAQHLTGDHIISALSGQATSQWRLTTDKKALVLSAAYPIYIDNQVKGAVIVEETTNGIRTLRNLALEKLFSVILAIMILGALTFAFFATRISARISRLSTQAEQAIDEHGRITGEVQASTANDEIGDLSRSFSRAVNRLGQYNHYLENMSARLSHELRTPIAVVKTSLEVLALDNESQSGSNNTVNKNAYIERAQTGINTLNLILTNMSEATRLEQILVNTEKATFNVTQLIKGCILGYQTIYPNITFNFINKDTNASDIELFASPEHIVQLLDKVINNAVEFSNDSSVLMTLHQQSQQLHLCVSNNGVHLPKAMLSSLFDSMVSIRSQSKQAQPHLGLGLYIARLICHFHQGEITAENHYDPNGVSIKITLPLHRDRI